MKWKPAIVVALISVLALTGCAAPPGGGVQQAVTRVVATLTSAARQTSAPATPRPTPTARPTYAPRPAATEGDALVVGVADGDSIWVKIDGETYPVRYIGVDTLETHDPSETNRYLAKLAAARNRALVDGKIVRLEKDVSETDRYGRLLRYVYVDDVMVNAELVRRGHAVVKRYAPDTKYHTLFEQLEAQAQAAEIGIWAPTSPVAGASASLRAGPGVTHAEVGIAKKGAPLEIVARDATGEWLQLASGAWIIAQYVEDPPPVLPTRR